MTGFGLFQGFSAEKNPDNKKIRVYKKMVKTESLRNPVSSKGKLSLDDAPSLEYRTSLSQGKTVLTHTNPQGQAHSLAKPNLQDYIIAATSDNTRLAYQKDIRHFISWGGLLPTDTETIVRYLQALRAFALIWCFLIQCRFIRTYKSEPSL